ncbi:MAG: glycosylhydrolase-like jelly roll fold domain-containing protein, partial [bacterium]
KPVQELTGPWTVQFDPKWGGPAQPAVFNDLTDWTDRSDLGIKYYSGIATYRKAFSLTQIPGGKTYLGLGVVHDMARVRLNGRDLGVVWCVPWRVEVTGIIKAGANQLEIEVANRWPNRMIGDKQPDDANARTTGRYTFSTHDPYKQQSPLLPSGLRGPVRLLTQLPEAVK